MLSTVDSPTTNDQPMPGFQFRLQSLQKLREHARDERRAALAQTFEAERLLEEEKGRLTIELASLKKHIRADASPGVVRVDRLLDVQRYEIVLRGQVEIIAGQQEQIQEEISRRRQALVEADKEVRVLEKLRERQQAEFQQGERRQASREMDEVAARRHLAKGAGK